ncbi:MAG TPA: hypothetical protein VER33_18765 [Polyangiaceae bacterium]|nr:hypothetical protein [Polyangiaceae bacterium]
MSAWLPRCAPWIPLCTALLVLGAGGSGCRSSCDNAVSGDSEELVETGRTSADGTVYESSPWDGVYLKFPPEKRYTFPHGLSGTPSVFNSYVSFWEEPLANGQEVSESAGNQVLIEGATATHFTVSNDTCETFYLRVTASLPFIEAPETPAAGGAGGGAAELE